MKINQQLNTIYDLIDQDNYIEAGKQLKEIDEEKLNKDEKLEFLQTKAEFFSKTLETEELLKTKEKIIKLLENKIKIIEEINPPSIDITKDLTSNEIVGEINISEIAKKISYSIKKEISTKILNSLIERFILNQQEGDLEEYENITTMYFQEIKYLKEIGESGEGFFYESLYYRLKGNKQKEQEAIKNSAYCGNRNSINLYLENLENSFLEEYKSQKKEQEKRKYKQKNLLNFEKEYTKFINGNFVSVEKKEISPRNPYLYEDLGLFFEKINEPKRALKSYFNGISSQYKGWYKLYLNISNLYKTNKAKSKDNKKSEYYYLKNLFDYSANFGDEEYMSIALEKFGDFFKYSNKELSQDYYKKAIDTCLEYFQTLAEQDKIIENIESALNNIVRLFEKTDTYILKIGDLDFAVQDFITQLINLNTKHLLTQAMFFEKQGNIFFALNSYIQNFQLHRDKNSLDALLMFLETTLKEKKLDTEIGKKIITELTLLKQTNFEEFQEFTESDINDLKEIIESSLNSLEHYEIELKNNS